MWRSAQHVKYGIGDVGWIQHWETALLKGIQLIFSEYFGSNCSRAYTLRRRNMEIVNRSQFIFVFFFEYSITVILTFVPISRNSRRTISVRAVTANFVGGYIFKDVKPSKRRTPCPRTLFIVTICPSTILCLFIDWNASRMPYTTPHKFVSTTSFNICVLSLSTTLVIRWHPALLIMI